MKSMLKTLLKVILIGLIVVYIGVSWAAESYSGGWEPYLCFVMVACTVVIVDKINKK